MHTVLFLLATALLAPSPASATSKPKAIVLMLGDDYGYNNVGFAHGPNGEGNPESRTPHLDTLARSGVVLERFYTYKYCSPTRSSLMTGRLPPHVNQNNKNNDIEATSGPDLRMTLLPAKMKEAGYYTAMVGKSHLASGSTHGEPHTIDLWSGHGPSNESGIYSGYLYTKKAVKVIRDFAARSSEAAEHASNASAGLFLYLAWHNTHTPLECPEEWMYPSLPAYNNSFPPRMTYNCMSHILDDGVGNVTAALRDVGLWEDTLLFFAADNGGWAGTSGASNWPLRGSKVSDFEGGVRVVSFLTGGANVLPEHVRGGHHSGYISIADIYGTVARLVDVSPTDDVPGLPPVDSNNFWPSVLTPNATSSGREEIFLSWSCTAGATADVVGCDVAEKSKYNTSGDPTAGQGAGDMALIWKHWKILIGPQNGRGVWFGPVYPNGTADGTDASCVRGCLFDIRADPTEHDNRKEAEPEIWASMLARLKQAGRTVYQTAYAEPGADNCISGAQAAKLYVGHNTCVPNRPGFNPSGPTCSNTTLRAYLGPMCFKTLPPGVGIRGDD